ncbi:hypothetical protein TNCV_4768721 [Trichonephila clavipes]|nr:hypothetical protein TNCV_4768721 [Trichonephila clavipes]
MNRQTKLRINPLTAVKSVTILESNANLNFYTWKKTLRTMAPLAHVKSIEESQFSRWDYANHTRKGLSKKKKKKKLTFVGLRGFFRFHDHADKRGDGRKHNPGDGGQHGGGGCCVGTLYSNERLGGSIGGCCFLSERELQQSDQKFIGRWRRPDKTSFPPSPARSASQWSHLRAQQVASDRWAPFLKVGMFCLNSSRLLLIALR